MKLFFFAGALTCLGWFGAPVQAGETETAAWYTARSICLALQQGLPLARAMRWGVLENQLWAASMQNELFVALTIDQVQLQCPALAPLLPPSVPGERI